MASVVVITTPNDGRAPDSVPRRVFEAVPDIEIDVEGVVPFAGSAIPYFWVWGEEQSRFQRVLEENSRVSSIAQLERVDGGALYRIEWDVDSPVFECIERSGGALMDAHGTAERWKLTIWFETGRGASRFLECCNARGVPVEVNRINSIAEEADGEASAVTTSQREALLVAYESGYFERPREITQEELADRLGISAAAAGTRLRRGISNIVERQFIQ